MNICFLVGINFGLPFLCAKALKSCRVTELYISLLRAGMKEYKGSEWTTEFSNAVREKWRQNPRKLRSAFLFK